MPETNQDGFFAGLNGTLAHEFEHTQRLLDLYDINTFWPAVGIWSNMDSGYLLGPVRISHWRSAFASGVYPRASIPGRRASGPRLDYVTRARLTTRSARRNYPTACSSFLGGESITWSRIASTI
jgi:hypothetical protein